MSLDAILAAIEATGETEAAHLRSEAAARARAILDEAERKAIAVREDARRTALRPSSSEQARRLHQAKLEALRTVGEIRQRLVETALAETRQHLMNLRADSNYPFILHRLIEEAVEALGDTGPHDGRVVLEIDPRDEVQVQQALKELGLDLQVAPSLNCWGGVVIRSSDGRVVVTNTLESRLERATPFLGQDLGAFMEKELERAATTDAV